MLASLRNVPVLMWNNSGDELVGPGLYEQTAMKLDNLGYRYELDVYRPCASPLCSPLFPDHLELAVNDQFAPAAAFLDTAKVDSNPAHVTYVVDAARNREASGSIGDHAYWVSGLTLRSQSPASNGDREGSIDAVSHGFGAGGPDPVRRQARDGTLTGGNMGDLSTPASRRPGARPLPRRAAIRSTSSPPTSPQRRSTFTVRTSTATCAEDHNRRTVDGHAPGLQPGRARGLDTLPGERPRFDLQCHSRHSDGELAPHEVVRAAALAGVELLALSDHDTVNGVEEARRTAGELGIALVAAVEISASRSGRPGHSRPRVPD